MATGQSVILVSRGFNLCPYSINIAIFKHGALQDAITSIKNESRLWAADRKPVS